jgi:hypothetical protein
MTDLDQLAAEAWIFGYPLVLMDVTRSMMTAHGQPPNTFTHLRAFPDHTFTDVVSPNADTLYSTAWLDLRAEPVVLSLPDLGDRYVTMPLLSAWTDVFAAPGSRTSGSAGGDFAIVGPGFTGELPAGVVRIDAPTAMVWLTGRTGTAGTRDYLAVHRLQDGYRLTPLSEFGPDAPAPRAVAPLSTSEDHTPPVDQVAAMDGPTFFGRLAALLVDNPAAAADADAVTRLGLLDVRPGQPVSTIDSWATVAAAQAAGPSGGQARLRQIGTPGGPPAGADRVNGWSILRGLGDYGTDYDRRAYVALIGLGANLDADAVYPHATVDDQGRALGGGHSYLLHFEPGQRPPVRGFWSLTVYNDKQFFEDNPIDRYAIGDRDDLQYTPDGSLDILIQHDEPDPAWVSNWLPAPTGSFNVFLRAYWPQQPVLSGAWSPPPITRLDPPMS